MAQDSGIGWTNHTVNFWWGCVEAGPECDNCYARELDARYKFGGETHWGKSAPRFIRTDKALGELRRYQRLAESTKTVQRIFINSMSDLFESRTELDAPRQRLFHFIDNGEAKDLRFMFLTKRPKNIARMVPQSWRDHGAPSNVALGTTVGTRQAAGPGGRVDQLLSSDVEADTWFLSIEPLLEDLAADLDKTFGDVPQWATDRLWFLVGGESGSDDVRREMEIPWLCAVERLANQYAIPFYCKQDSGRQPGKQGRIPGGIWGRKDVPYSMGA